METPKNKKKRKKELKQSNKLGVDNNSFEMDEMENPNEKAVRTAKDSKKTSAESSKARGQPKRRVKENRLKKHAKRSASESVRNQSNSEQTRKVAENSSTGITIHRCDALRVDPHISHLMVRVHVMDERSGVYLKRHAADENKDGCYVQPVGSKAVRTGPGQFLLPIWEQTLVIKQAFSDIVENPSTVILFEILNCNVNDDFTSGSNATGQPLDLLAWAFLRPLSVNGRPNVGSRKQRLQLYEPIVSAAHSTLCARASMKRSTRADAQTNDPSFSTDPACQSGIELMACWSAGQSHRLKYPSTLYVSVYELDLGDSVASTTLKLQTFNAAELGRLNADEEASRSRSSLDKRHIAFLSSSTIHTAWRRDMDQPCRVPNELVGRGMPWTGEDTGAPRTGKWSIIGSSARSNCGAQCVRFSPNGLWLAVGSTNPSQETRMTEVDPENEDRFGLDCAVWLYQYPLKTRNSAPELQLTGHTRTVYAVEWAPCPVTSETPSSNTSVQDPTSKSITSWPLASASGDGTVRVWWISPGLLNGVQAGCKGSRTTRSPTIVSMSEAGVASSSSHEPVVGQGHVRAGTTSHKGVFCAVLGHPGFVYSLAFRPLNNARPSNYGRYHVDDPLTDWFVPQPSHLLATAGYDQSVRLWNIGSRRAELLTELTNAHHAHINSVAFTTDGQKLFSADAQGMICVWIPTRVKQPVPGHQQLSRWNLKKRLKNDELNDCVINHIEPHPRQPLLLVHTRDSNPKMIDLRSEFVAVRFHGSLNYHQLIRSCISPCGSFVFSGSEDRNLYVWNALTGDQVACYRNLQLRSSITAISYHPTDNAFAIAVQACQEAPLRVYAYDPKATTLEMQSPQKEPVPIQRAKRFDTEREHIEHVCMMNEKRKRERIKTALSKLDSVLNTTVKSGQLTDELDDLEWRPTFTAIDEPKHAQLASRGRPDGEAKRLDPTDHPKSPQSLSLCLPADQPHLAVAMYDYRAERSDELTLRRGDRVQLLYRDTPKWWMARDLNSGREGFVPTNYLAFDENATKSLVRDKLSDDQCASGKTPGERSRLSAQKVSQLLDQFQEASTPKPPNIVVQNFDEQDAAMSRRRPDGLRSMLVGPPSPANLITLTPRPSQIDIESKRRVSRPLPVGEDTNKRISSLDPSSFKPTRTGGSSDRVDVTSVELSETVSFSSLKRRSRPLPELE